MATAARLDAIPCHGYIIAMPTSRYLDWASLATIVITLVLFAVAVIVKGFTHELLLEAAVFLVSVKLILMSHKNGVVAASISERLARIEAILSTRG